MSDAEFAVASKTGKARRLVLKEGFLPEKWDVSPLCVIPRRRWGQRRQLRATQ
jgi:hypothetical protein